MKRTVFAGLISIVLSGCAPTPPIATAYALPENCDIKELVALDKSYEVFDKTESGVTDSRDCAIGVANSDVGIFFGYSVRTEAEWSNVTAKLAEEGYEKWNSGYEGADVWRAEIDDDMGASCSLSGHVAGISFSVTEPWTTCDDKWNKELVAHLLNHATSSF